LEGVERKARKGKETWKEWKACREGNWGREKGALKMRQKEVSRDLS
jgi:hypothetical protein